MSIELWHLVVYFCAGLAVILGLNPKIIKKLVKRLLDETFIQDYQDENRDKLRELIVPEIENAVRGLLEAKMSELGITIDYDELGRHVKSHIDSWYANLMKKQYQQDAEAEQYIKEAGEYAQINQGNPEALDAIRQQLFNKALSRSPTLALGLQLLQGGNSGGSVRQGGARKGGY